LAHENTSGKASRWRLRRDLERDRGGESSPCADAGSAQQSTAIGVVHESDCTRRQPGVQQPDRTNLRVAL